MLEVSYFGVPIKVYSFTGQVVDSNKHLETKVTGSGGGGAMYQGNGAIAPVSIQSSTTVHDQFFLVNEDGKEISVKLQNWDVSLRSQHTLQVIWAIPGKATTGPYVTIKNHNLNELSWSQQQLKAVVSPCLLKHALIGIGAAIVLGYLLSSFGTFIIVGIMTYIYFMIRRNILAQDLRKKIEAALV